MATAVLGSAHAETLTSAVSKALESNPELGAIRQNRSAIDQELRAARGLILPTLDVTADLGRHKFRSKTPLISNNYATHTHREVAVIASQRLFDGFEAAHEIARQKSRVTSARWRVTDTANAIALRAIQAYLEVQRARAVLAAAESNVAALGRLASRVERRVSAGQASSAERSEAGSRYASARAVLIEARAKVDDAIALYVSVIGEQPQSLRPVGLPRDLPRTRNAAIELAKASAPSIHATDSDRIAAEASIGTARAEYYPKLNAELSSRYGDGLKEDGDSERGSRAMLVARWNIFNGGIDTARVREARARAQEAAEIAANTARIVVRETETSWNSLNAARGRVPALQRQLELTRKTRATYNAHYDAGLRRLLDLLDAQSEVFIAEADLKTEELVLKFSAYRLLAAMGQLVPALGLELPPEAISPPEHWRTDDWGYRIYHRGETREAWAAETTYK